VKGHKRRVSQVVYRLAELHGNAYPQSQLTTTLGKEVVTATWKFLRVVLTACESKGGEKRRIRRCKAHT
jgi:hypothetical protein